MAGDFGFKNDESAPTKPQVSTNLLAHIKPRTAPRPSINIAESDRAAESVGFSSREPSSARPPVAEVYGTPRRQKRTPEPTTAISMRVPRSIHVRFRDFADERKLSYPEALEKLLDNNEILERLERKQ